MKENLKRMFKNVNPAALIIILVLLINNMLSSNVSAVEWLSNQLLILPGILVGLTFHEAAHGYASYWLGDPTPKLQRRLSFNPIRHIDPIGFLALLFCGFGWGQPVQIDPTYYKHKRRDELIVSLTGVVSNFIIAVVSSVAIKVLYGQDSSIISWMPESMFYILYYMMSVNLVLMVFNLLPVPPLDGFGMVTQIFNLRRYDWYWSIYNNGFYILMILIVFDITDKILTPAVGCFIEILLW